MFPSRRSLKKCLLQIDCYKDLYSGGALSGCLCFSLGACVRMIIIQICVHSSFHCDTALCCEQVILRSLSHPIKRRGCQSVCGTIFYFFFLRPFSFISFRICRSGKLAVGDVGADISQEATYLLLLLFNIYIIISIHGTEPTCVQSARRARRTVECVSERRQGKFLQHMETPLFIHAF